MVEWVEYRSTRTSHANAEVTPSQSCSPPAHLQYVRDRLAEGEMEAFTEKSHIWHSGN